MEKIADNLGLSWNCPFHVLVFSAISTGVLYSFSKRIISLQQPRIIPRELENVNFTPELVAATAIALEAGGNIMAQLNKEKKVTTKGPNDFVTETDKLNELIIFTALRSAFPNHSFIGEESTAESGVLPELTDNPTWIVNKIAVMGIVYHPMNKELFQSIRGHGAYLNNSRMSTSAVTRLQDCLLLTEFGYQRDVDKLAVIMRCLQVFVTSGVHAFRSLGSGVLDLCYVACGRLDVVYAGVAGESWYPWDYCAGGLMIEEAGGCLSTVHGESFHVYSDSVVACANKELLSETLNTIQQAL